MDTFTEGNTTSWRAGRRHVKFTGQRAKEKECHAAPDLVIIVWRRRCSACQRKASDFLRPTRPRPRAISILTGPLPMTRRPLCAMLCYARRRDYARACDAAYICKRLGGQGLPAGQAAARKRKGSPLQRSVRMSPVHKSLHFPVGDFWGWSHDRRGIGFSSTCLRSTLYQDHFVAMPLQTRHCCICFESSRLPQHCNAECGGSSLLYPHDAMQVALSPISSAPHVPAYLLSFCTSCPRNVSAQAVGKSLNHSASPRNERGTWAARVVSVVTAQGAGMLVSSKASTRGKMAQPVASQSGDQCHEYCHQLISCGSRAMRAVEKHRRHGQDNAGTA